MVEKVGDKLNIVDKQTENDLNRFKAFIEDEGYATGAWRGTVNEGTPAGAPGVDAAAGSRGVSGKAGVSGKVVAGVGLAAAAAAGIAAATRHQKPAGDPAPGAVHTLSAVAARRIATKSPSYGFCMYRSGTSGKFYAFVAPNPDGSSALRGGAGGGRRHRFVPQVAPGETAAPRGEGTQLDRVPRQLLVRHFGGDFSQRSPCRRRSGQTGPTR